MLPTTSTPYDIIELPAPLHIFIFDFYVLNLHIYAFTCSSHSPISFQHHLYTSPTLRRRNGYTLIFLIYQIYRLVALALPRTFKSTCCVTKMFITCTSQNNPDLDPRASQPHLWLASSAVPSYVLPCISHVPASR